MMRRSLSSLKGPSLDQTALLHDALAYAERGWSVIPTIGKKPAVPSWRPFQQKPADGTTLHQLFARNGVTGLAVILGKASGGLAVRDYDLGDAYHAWATSHPDDAARLPTVKTARGFHVYGRLHEDTFIRFADGELRGDSLHYVLLPPSVHPDGSIYIWLYPLPEDGTPLPFLPSSLITQTQTEESPKQTSNPLHVSHTHNACVPPAAVEAIEATLPDGPGQRNRKVFDLARRLKGIAGLDTSPAMLKAIITEWHRRALPVITTKDFAETWSDFQTAWLAVKTPHGTTVQAAYQAARRAPLQLDDNEDLGILAALCRNLSAAVGGKPFYLSCRMVEKLFGVSRMTAWRSLKALQFYGKIECVKKGTLKNHQATTWRFISTEGG